MQGQMQTWPLITSRVLEYAARWHGRQEIVCRTVEGPTVVSTYADLATRAKLCALALRELGLSRGDVVGTLAWNTTRHLEAWHGIMGSGLVCHTLNPRLSDADIAYIAHHGEEAVILADLTFLPILGRIWQQLPRLRHIVVLTDRQHMPGAGAPGLPPPRLLLCYEALLDAALDALPRFTWPQDLDENSPAALCYTSGTTGNPKGVRYSHRSNILHSFITCLPDALGLGAANTVLMVVPMFHANSWGLGYSAPMVGCRLVLPGPNLDGASLFHLIETYSVDTTAAVPTVVLGLLQHMRAHAMRDMRGIRRLVIGGAAPPRAMIEEVEGYGVDVRHMWGMTEISPVGSLGTPSGAHLADGPLSREEIIDLKVSQGRPHVLCDMRLVDEAGRELPCDGKAVGNLQVRGDVVVGRYHKHEAPTTDAQRWFDTGDVASISPLGVMTISDRSKDVVKSGGEWISSIGLENTAMGHPKVQEAAVIGVPDDRWGERPLLIVVPAPGAGPAEAVRREVLQFMAEHPQVAKFAVPDDVVLVAEIPHTATGKISKLSLRNMFAGHRAGRAASKL